MKEKEAVSMIIDTMLMVIFVGYMVIGYTILFAMGNRLSAIEFVFLLITSSVSFVFSVAAIDAVISYFTEPYEE